MTKKRKPKQPKFHLSFGPIPPEEFKKSAEAPFGEAQKIIRKYAPDFHRQVDEESEDGR